MTRPLVLITRPLSEAKGTASALDKRGFNCFIEPMLDITYPAGAKATLHQTLSIHPQAVIVTSSNGARALSHWHVAPDVPILCVGEKTHSRAERKGFTNVTYGGDDVAALTQYIKTHYNPHKGTLVYASANAVSGQLVRNLTAVGFDIRRVVVYHSKPRSQFSEEFLIKLRSGEFRLGVFYSSRTADTFCELVHESGLESYLTAFDAFCLSRTIAERLLSSGVKGVYYPALPKQESLLELITKFQLT